MDCGLWIKFRFLSTALSGVYASNSFEYTTMDFLSDLLGQCSDLYGAMVVKADDTIDHITEVDTFVPGEHSYTQPSTHARTPLLLHVTLSQPYRLLG